MAKLEKFNPFGIDFGTIDVGTPPPALLESEIEWRGTVTFDTRPRFTYSWKQQPIDGQRNHGPTGNAYNIVATPLGSGRYHITVFDRE